MTTDPDACFRFAGFELDAAAYELRRDGAPIRLERQPMEVLLLLVERGGRLVSRQDIVDRLWGSEVFVDVDTGVNTAIRKIRAALRDPAETPRFIETVAGKGYRFVAPVERVSGKADAQPEAAGTAPPLAAAAGGVWSSAMIAAAIALVLIVGAAVAALWPNRDDSPTTRRTLAVLPFENLSGDPARDYLADGLAEETIATLGQIDPAHVMVIGRTSVMTYKGTTKSLATIGRELGVDYLVEGSVRAEGAQVRVTSKLIRVHDQMQIWSDSYDRAASSLLAVQRELSTAIAQQVRLRLSPERLSALARRQTRNAEAYDLYLRGRGFANQRTPAATVKAIEYFDRATRLDPAYALAWAGLAEAYGASPVNGDADPQTVASQVREAARNATAADPGLAEAQFSQAYVSWMFDWNWAAAIASFRHAEALGPGEALHQAILGHVLSQVGRHDEARAYLKRAREMDPFSGMPHAMSSQVAFQARDFSAALEHARQAIAVDERFWIGHMMAGQAYAELGKIDQAFDAFAEAARLSGGNSKPLSNKGHLLARTGRPAEARAILAAFASAARTRYVPPYALALIHAGLGERDAAFEWLERAYAARDVHLIFLTQDPKWDGYRDDPRFSALLTRCGFDVT